MAGVTTSTLSTTIIPTPYRERQQIIDTVFKYADTYAMWPDLAAREGVASFGGDGYEIPLTIAGNSSGQVFVENGLVPDAGYQQRIVAKAAYKSLRIFTRLTGHARRQMGRTWDSPENAPWIIGGRDDEAEMALQDLLSLWEQTFLGSSKATYNLYGILDDSTTAFYDQSRSTYATLACYVKTASAALTTAILDAALAALYDATYGGRTELLLMSPTQARKYTQLVAGKVAVAGSADIAGGSGGTWDLPPYAGIPIMVIRGMTSSLIHMVSGLDRNFGWANHEPAPGGIDILPYGVLSDAKIVQYVMAGALICKQPRQQGTIESLGTT